MVRHRNPWGRGVVLLPAFVSQLAAIHLQKALPKVISRTITITLLAKLVGIPK